MGLTRESSGSRASAELKIEREKSGDIIVALEGNPNVGKSTLFNALTGMNQHTGNWPGKTVATACGRCEREQNGYLFVDLPGTYSLMAHSAEEEIARDFLCFGNPDAVVVVCDATCLERNLNLLLQTTEITAKTVLCLNLMDEAEKKGIRINTKKLEEILNIPVVPVTARKNKGLDELLKAIRQVAEKPASQTETVKYLPYIQKEKERLTEQIKKKETKNISPGWIALRVLEENEELLKKTEDYLGQTIQREIFLSPEEKEKIKDNIVSCLVLTAESIAAECVTEEKKDYNRRDRKIDRFLTGKATGIPIMILLLTAILWLTITGANYPSQGLSWLFSQAETAISQFLTFCGAPEWVRGILADGMFRVLFWVVAVMLPPMAIFFPLFTLLEDLGYLPRVAFNLDRYFHKSGACGKQSLTMCMGFGCNAAGVVGCRIIDSPRERLIGILTNNFVPCNGRFPILITLISIFFATSATAGSSFLSALFLTGFIILGIFFTFAVSKILSKTLLKGIPSSFTLELPPYRTPQVGKIIVRSIFDRTLFVLGRAAAVAAPAGILIWLAANLRIGETTVLTGICDFMDPFGKFLGMDGVILTAFILGFPANETVLPITIMGYLAQGTLNEVSTSAMAQIFTDNGWTLKTAVCVMLFTINHWPCSTTLLSVKKETKSLKWTAAAFLIPTVMGIVVCALTNAIWNWFL